MGKPITSFEDLLVYQRAFRLQQTLFAHSKHFPADERFSLTDQLRRASRSVGADVAEAWHKRRYEAHFVSKLSDADAEVGETRHWLHTAKACSYLSREQHEALVADAQEIGRLLGAMMNDPRPWLLRSSHR